MASASSSTSTSSSTPSKEKTNYSRLCRLLINDGTLALREFFDNIQPPTTLHTLLHSAAVHHTLQGLRARRILTTQQWGRLYPATTPVTSTGFDITLLFALLRNICGLAAPTTGWDKPPLASDLCQEADLARIKWYRNELYGHITEAALSDSDFEKHWREISALLIRLGGPNYKPRIERLKVEALDSEDEKYFINMIKEWEQTDHRVIDKLEQVMDQLNKMEGKLPGVKVADIARAGGNTHSTPADSDQPTEKDPSRAQGYTNKLKPSIKKTSDSLLMPEEEDKRIRTDERFTNVTIERGQKHFQEDQDGRFRRGQFDNFQATSKTLKTCCEMFMCPEDDDQKSTATSTTNPKSILLTGKAGIGKSLFCLKLIRDWADDKLFEQCVENTKLPDFQFAFLLTFRQLSLLEHEELDLCDILNLSSLLDEQSIIDEALLQYIIQNPEKLLIIFDGYDEYKHREEITGDFETKYPNNPCKKIPVPALIAKIMKGKMLKESVVMISSRPGEADELKTFDFDARCEIKGFSSLQVIEYVDKYFKDYNESTKKEVIDHIKANEILISFGHIPVMCFLMCYCIKWSITQAKTTKNLPVTRTELYHEVITLFIKKHSSKYKEITENEFKEILHKLAKLAVNLMKEGKYIFNENDMKRFNFSEKEITNLKASGLFDCCPGVKKSPSEKTTLEFVFTHLTIQEYLCAFGFVEIKHKLPKIKKTSDATVIFMAGVLSRKKDEKLMEKLMKNIPLDEGGYIGRYGVLRLQCLYEYRDDKLSKRVINNLHDEYCDSDGRIYFSNVSDMDYVIYLIHIIGLLYEEQTKKHPTSTQSFIVKSLVIVGSSLSPSGVRMLCSSLVSISTLTEMWLWRCKLDDECIAIISDSLILTRITTLNLSSNNITDVGVTSLCTVLTNKNCTVQRLYLGGCKLDDECLAIISDSLISSRITSLNLSYNNITDVGVTSLCTVLTNKDCTVQGLDLGSNKITAKCKESTREFVQQHKPDVYLSI